MARIRCKICRRIGEKLCSRGKCAIVRKPYPPGSHGKKRRRAITEYGRQLAEKQKIKALYGLGERQLRRYVTSALGERQNTINSLLSELETRLDNTAFRLGLVRSPSSARQASSHGHFLVNGKRITIPSYRLQPGDVVTVRGGSRAKGLFDELNERLKKYTPPPWLELNREDLSGKVLRAPTLQDIDRPPANLQRIVEYYSR